MFNGVKRKSKNKTKQSKAEHVQIGRESFSFGEFCNCGFLLLGLECRQGNRPWLSEGRSGERERERKDCAQGGGDQDVLKG